MLGLDVRFLPDAAPQGAGAADVAVVDVAVVIDVLRMTTTAAVLLERGMASLTVVASVDAARAEARSVGALLLGERGGVKLPGFDHGNSPLEFGELDLAGRRGVLCTTNGSKAVEASAAARHLLLGAIVNDAAVAARAVALAESGITLVCAGTEGRVALEDALGAACILERVLELEPAAELTDAARLALLALRAAGDLEAGVRGSRHAATLAGLGFDADVAFAARRGALSLVAERVAGPPARFELVGDGPAPRPPTGAPGSAAPR